MFGFYRQAMDLSYIFGVWRHLVPRRYQEVNCEVLRASCLSTVCMILTEAERMKSIANYVDG
jgi:hypothetical protein